MVKQFSRYLKGYQRPALLAPLLVVAEACCELTLPLLMARIINVGIVGGGGMGYIFKMGGMMVALAILSMVCGVLAAKYASVASQGFGANLRGEIFNHVQGFSFADIDRFSSASLITRMTNDVNNIQMMVNMGLRIMTRAPVMLIAALVLCFTLNARLSWVLVVVILVMGCAIALLMTSCHKLFDHFQKSIDGLNETVQENLVAIRVVKAFVRSAHEKIKFKAANDNLTHAGIKAVSRIILQQPIMMLCFNAATIGVLWLGGQQVMAGGMPMGDLSSFLTYIAQILMSVMMVAMSLLQLTRSMACVHRIGEVLKAQPSITTPTQPATLPTPQGKIEFQGVSFRYGGMTAPVLQNIGLTIMPGQFTAIIGGTGAGKSSLVNLIPRFYDVEEGAVLLDGVDVRHYPLETLRSRVGMVLQTNVLFSGTIRENLLWGKEDATDQELEQAAQDAQALDFIQAQPQGFDTVLSQGGVNLSGGQKQRLCIARAMLRQPAVLILDDSTSAVDTATEGRIRTSFRKNLKDTTILLIAQRISSVEGADQIIVLDEGRVVATGTHADLLATSAIYQEIVKSQQQEVAG